MNNLQLSLKKKWFEMTKAGVKTEDYREITPYWCSRLLTCTGGKRTQEYWSDMLTYPTTESTPILQKLSTDKWLYKFEEFDLNIMTLGYPKSTESDRTLKLEHKGIEIREGNPEWGAEPGRLYFVIKHGKRIL
jgi:hypothetical protein